MKSGFFALIYHIPSALTEQPSPHPWTRQLCSHPKVFAFTAASNGNCSFTRHWHNFLQISAQSSPFRLAFLGHILKISASIIFCPLPWHIYLPRIYRYRVSICCLPLPLECGLHEDRKLILFTATPVARTMPRAWQAYSQISWKNELLLGAQQEQQELVTNRDKR